jgi:hypothetical protein
MGVIKKVLAVGVSFVVLLVVSVLTAGWWFSQPKFDEVLESDPLHQLTIAPLGKALTFARTRPGPGSRVLLVTAASGGSVTGVDLADAFGQAFADSIEAFETLGFETLSEAATSAPSVSVAFDDLVLPFEPVFPHIAAGTNFQAHAEEVGLDDEPFLFPKMSHATAWNDAVAMGTRLDYEVELCPCFARST